MADRRAADVGSDAEVLALRAKLNELVLERQRLINEGVKPTVTEADLKAAQDMAARKRAVQRYYELFPTLRGPNAAPATGGPAAPPVQILDDVNRKAGEAEKKLDRVGSMHVEPTVSVSGIEKALALVDQLQSKLSSIGGMHVSPSVTPRIAPATGSPTSARWNGLHDGVPGRRAV